ncbi:MAG: hypothetical protein M1817_004509 [Caeruleum heppii]|nr:MAG: hypothetical protein M1817_004509 [Caeruleum heppii]
MASFEDPRVATVEDYDSDLDNPTPRPRRAVDSRHRKANVPPINAYHPHNGDFQSDSGYSSHAAATVASSDSTGPQSLHTSPTQARYRTAMPSPKKQRPPLTSSKTTPTERLPEPRAKTPSHTRTRSKSRPVIPPQQICGCVDCTPHRRPTPSPLETAWDLNYPPFVQPARYRESRPSFSSRIYAQEAPTTAAPQPRPQTLRAARPMSYHAGSSYAFSDEDLMAELYGQGLGRGPPLSMSAYSNASPGTASYSPHTPYLAIPTFEGDYVESPRYEAPRPAPRPVPPRRATETQRPRPVSMYGAPVIDYDRPPSTAPPMTRRASARDHYEEEYYSREEQDAQRMPPPPRPGRRPSVRRTSHSTSRHDIPRSGYAPSSDTGATVAGERPGRPMTPHPLDSGSRRPSFTAPRRPKSKSYTDGAKTIQVESRSRQRPVSYYGHEKTRDLEREAQAYQESMTRTMPLTAETLKAQRRSRRHGSDSGSQGRTTSSREGSEIKSRSGSGMNTSVPDGDENLTVRFHAGSGVKLDFSGGLDGRTISLKPGQSGEPAELSIRSHKSYSDRSSGTHYEYPRSDRREEIENGQRPREVKSSTRSRRSSRAPPPRQPS